MARITNRNLKDPRKSQDQVEMRTTSTAGLSFSYVYAPEVISLGAILPVVGIAIVGVRIYLRRVQKAAISIDDWLVLAALVRRHSLPPFIKNTMVSLY